MPASPASTTGLISPTSPRAKTASSCDPAELVARHPAELAAVGGGLGVLAVLLGQLREGVGIVLELRGDVLRLGLRALALAGLLDHVPAEAGPNRLADLSDLELGEGGRELRHVRRVLGVGPAQVAAARARAGVVAVLLGDRVPVGVIGLEQPLDLLRLGLAAAHCSSVASAWSWMAGVGLDRGRGALAPAAPACR